MPGVSYFDYPVTAYRPTVDQYSNWLRRQRRMTSLVSTAVDRANAARDQYGIIGYVAGPLTDVIEDDKKRYERVSALMGEFGMFGYVPHLYGTDPVLHQEVTVDEVRDIDFLWAVVMPDFHVNFLSPVAHGNGVEAGWGEILHIPSIFCAPEGMKITRLVRGLLTADFLIRYQNVEEVYPELRAIFSELMRWKQNCRRQETVSSFFMERKRINGSIVDPPYQVVTELAASCCFATVDLIGKVLWSRGLLFTEEEMGEIISRLVLGDMIYLAGLIETDGSHSPYFLPVSLRKASTKELYPLDGFVKVVRGSIGDLSGATRTVQAMWERLSRSYLPADQERFAMTLQELVRSGGVTMGITCEGSGTLVPYFVL